MNPQIARMQAYVKSAGLDGWLLYDFRQLNPLALELLALPPAMLTRRWFLFVPAEGAATLIHHRIEAATWQSLLPDPSLRRVLFSAHQELDEALRKALHGARAVAMEYSPLGEVPYVSRVDGGTLERVRALGVEIVSSADLLQHFMVWSEEDLAAHLKAVAGVIAAKDAGFALIRSRLAGGEPVSELEVQAALLGVLQQHGLEYDHPPIVAFGSHASDGHYAPDPASNRCLERGMCILLDLWAGLRDRPMADITWVGFAGEPDGEYLRAWEAVRDARDLAIGLLTSRAAAQGWEVDRAARDLIASRGFGSAFRHRLGHSLGRNFPHGPAVNLDDLETHDTRRLLPGLAVTVEPGVYLGRFGVRSEVNVLITPEGARVTTPIQPAPYLLTQAGRGV